MYIREESVSFSHNEQNKRGKKPNLLAMNQLFMFLVWLKNGLTLELTNWLFDPSKSTVVDSCCCNNMVNKISNTRFNNSFKKSLHILHIP